METSLINDHFILQYGAKNRKSEKPSVVQFLSLSAQGRNYILEKKSFFSFSTTYKIKNAIYVKPTKTYPYGRVFTYHVVGKKSTKKIYYGIHVIGYSSERKKNNGLRIINSSYTSPSIVPAFARPDLQIAIKHLWDDLVLVSAGGESFAWPSERIILSYCVEWGKGLISLKAQKGTGIVRSVNKEEKTFVTEPLGYNGGSDTYHWSFEGKDSGCLDVTPPTRISHPWDEVGWEPIYPMTERSPENIHTIELWESELEAKRQRTKERSDNEGPGGFVSRGKLCYCFSGLYAYRRDLYIGGAHFRLPYCGNMYEEHGLHGYFIQRGKITDSIPLEIPGVLMSEICDYIAFA